MKKDVFLTMNHSKENDQKILQLINSEEAANIELAFQLCVSIGRNYDWEVAFALRRYPYQCLVYNLEIATIKTRRSLNLANYHMKVLPPAIIQFTQLEELDLSDNHFSIIPQEIYALTSLTQLHLAENQLTELHPQITQLKNLQILNLLDNQITHLPPQIGNLLNSPIWYLLITNLPVYLPK